MKARKINFFAKILIFFSIILISCGLVLQIKDNAYPNLNNVIEPEEDNFVSITVVDQEIDDDLDGEQEQVEEIEEDKGEVKDSDSSSNNPVGDSSIPSNPVPSSEPSPSNKPTPSTNPTPSNPPSGSNDSNNSSNNNGNSNGGEVVEKPLTTEEKNIQLRDLIQSTYGVTIKYGSETSGYSVGGLSTTVISDANVAQKALNDLNSALALYPNGFFKELSSNFKPLTFYLVKNYSKPSVTGVTSSDTGKVDISIATDFGFGDTFHHEVYHYIEYYMKNKGFTYTSWNTLNPIEFSYGTINQSYSYDSTFSEDSYFVNSYAQTSPEEDRASTFEYMMSNSKASCLNFGKVVWTKAKAMSEAIDYYLDSVSPNVNEYWERFVY